MLLQKIWICSLVITFCYVKGSPLANNIDDNNIEESTIDNQLGLLTKCSLDGGFTSLLNCAAARALKLIQHAAKSESLVLYPGVSLVSDKSHMQRDGKSLNIELPENPSEKTDALLDLILHSASRLFSGRSIKIDIPEITRSVENSLEEARAKKKKGGGGPLMWIIGAKLLLVKSLMIAILKFMSIKALIIAKIALIISVIAAGQSLFGKGGGSGIIPYLGGSGVGSGYGSGWNGGGSPVYGPPNYSSWTTNGIGGWSNSQYPYARSINEDELDSQTEAQDLAYSNQKP